MCLQDIRTVDEGHDAAAVSIMLLLVGERYIMRIMYVPVCMSLCSYITGTTHQNSTKFSVHVAYGRGLVLLWQCCSTLCLCTPSLWMASFCPKLSERRQCKLSVNMQCLTTREQHQTGGGECDVYECLVLCCSEEQAKLAARKYARIVQKLGFQVCHMMFVLK